jgi:CBS domain containing-hemolysin-like protein
MWLAIFSLLFVRALVAAAESALQSISELKAKQLSALYPEAGRRVMRLKADREPTAATIRVFVILCGVLAAALGALAPPWESTLTGADASSWQVIASALLSAFLVGILATLMEVSARSLASNNPERWALALSGWVKLLVSGLYPATRWLLSVLNILAKPFGRRIRFETPPLPLDELEKLLAAQAANAMLDQSAPQLIRSIFELSDKRCRDVMVARTEVVSIEINTSPMEILRLLAEENHSRIPVYRDDIDHIVGVLHARDLIPLLQHPELIVLADIIRPAHFVPWIKPIGDLLREMQKKKIHMAMVVDEYGGFMGIVTLEDILREIVGDIGDEFEVEEKLIDKQADGSFLVDASMEVGDFGTAFGFSLPEGDYETMGGFLSSLAGSLPETGDRFSFNGWQFIVQTKEGPRLGRVRLIRPKGAVPSPAKEAAGPATEKDLRTGT